MWGLQRTDREFCGGSQEETTSNVSPTGTATENSSPAMIPSDPAAGPLSAGVALRVGSNQSSDVTVYDATAGPVGHDRPGFHAGSSSDRPGLQTGSDPTMQGGATPGGHANPDSYGVNDQSMALPQAMASSRRPWGGLDTDSTPRFAAYQQGQDLTPRPPPRDLSIIHRGY